MPVFDFSDTPNEKKDPECTYEVFYSNESEAKRKARMEAIKNRPAGQRPNGKQIDFIKISDK